MHHAFLAPFSITTTRLKLRCDRAIPCASCVKRGCAAICPDGMCPPLRSSYPLSPPSFRLVSQRLSTDGQRKSVATLFTHRWLDVQSILERPDSYSLAPKISMRRFMSSQTASESLKTDSVHPTPCIPQTHTPFFPKTYSASKPPYNERVSPQSSMGLQMTRVSMSSTPLAPWQSVTPAEQITSVRQQALLYVNTLNDSKHDQKLTTGGL